MRLACFGLVDDAAGSVAGANYLVLRELVDRGVAVDFYAERQFVREPGGLDPKLLTYLGFERPGWVRRLPSSAFSTANWLLTPLVRRSWAQIFAPVASARNRVARYDALLSLGTAPAFSIPGVPTITWLQGPRHTESQALRRLRCQVRQYERLSYYLLLRAYYAPRQYLDRHQLDSSDLLICGSRWAQGELMQHEGKWGAVEALPYPIALDEFRPSERLGVDWDQPTIVCVGRLVPRKRLDLLLDAFPLVLREFPAARLKIVGSPGYASGQLALLERSRCRARIDYIPRLDRREITALLQKAAVAVQTSESENFGSAIAEAQACGAPVVVGPTNGTKDYIDSASSKVFAEYTPESVAAAVVAAIEAHRRAPEDTRDAARRSAERWFAPRSVVDALLAHVTSAKVATSHAGQPLPAGAHR
jgi:glycosyltransferase involved in cell wall biosynthesis